MWLSLVGHSQAYIQDHVAGLTWQGVALPIIFVALIVFYDRRRVRQSS
jgi:hypothetical protein